MTKQQQNVKDFMIKAGQETPDKPIIPDEQTLKLRIKLLLEEVFELAKASGVTIIDKNSDLQLVDTNHLFFSADTSKVDLVAVADGLCDIDYVNLGAATAYGLDLEPFQKEVQRSNMSKFIDGHLREDGKWIKGPSYSEANLGPILEKQQGPVTPMPPYPPKSGFSKDENGNVVVRNKHGKIIGLQG